MEELDEGVLKESPHIKPEEEGTAIKIEKRIEEGVPSDIIDEELKKDQELNNIEKEKDIKQRDISNVEDKNE